MNNYNTEINDPNRVNSNLINITDEASDMLNDEPEEVEMMDDDDEDDDDDDDEYEDVETGDNLKEFKKDENILDDNDNLIKVKSNYLLNKNYYGQEEQTGIGISVYDKLNDDENDENEDRKRFQIELEFVQSLANPNYLNFLAQRGYFKNQRFINYLKYLMYWKEPEYCKYLMYPQCLSLLELLQHEQFLKEIVNAACSKYIDEQILLVWLHYKKRRDWIRIDPTKIPENIEKLFHNQTEDYKITQENESSIQDPFVAATFISNEKF